LKRKTDNKLLRSLSIFKKGCSEGQPFFIVRQKETAIFLQFTSIIHVKSILLKTILS